MIVGGGIIGCSIAWRLAQQGLRIAIVEAGQLGAEASSAAAGMLAPGGEFEAGSPLAIQAVESLRLYPGFVSELTAESGVAIDFRRCGAIEYPAGERNLLAERAERQRTAGIAAEPQPDGSVLYPDDAIVDPRQIVAALRRICERRRIEVIKKRVDFVKTNLKSVRIGETEARSAVIAAGAWSSLIRIAGHTLPEVFPVRGHLLGYRLAPGFLPRIVRRGHTYIFQRTNGYLVAGSDAQRAGFDRGPDPVRTEKVRNEAEQLLPALAAFRPDDIWTGFRPATESGEPHIGPLADTRIWLAYGHYRNGILFAPHTAARIAGEVIATLGKG